jgi:integrase
MATFLERRNRDGQLIGYQAQIRKKGYPTQVKTFDKKADAVAWATVIESEMIRGVHVDRSKAERTTFADAIDDYIREEAPRHKGSEAEILRLKRFVRDEPKLVAHSLATLTTRLFEQFRDRRLNAVVPGTVKRELGLLHTVIEFVRKTHGMAENPISDVERPSAPDERDVRLNEGAGRLMEACEDARNPWLVPAVLLALETGLRRGALLALRWQDVDLETRTVRVQQTVRAKNVPRTIPLSSLAIAVLDGLEKSHDGRVIGTTAEGLKQAFERARSRAGMEHFNFHDLRHEATSRLFERGWNVMEVAAVTGHKDLQMLKRYTNLRAEDLAAKMG